jgi:dihydroorotase
MTGLETALSVVQHAMIDTKLLTWADLADRMSYRPAAIGQISEHGQPLEVGAPANLVLVDPAAERTVVPTETASLSRNTPFAGMKLPGKVTATFLRGEPTVLDGKLTKSGISK